MKRVSLMFCFILLFNYCFGQMTLEGTIKDVDSGEPLVGATVKAGEAGTTSDVNGFFALNIKNSTEVTISYIGYTTIVLPLNEQGTQVVEIQMESTSTVLDVATVTGSKYERSIARAPVSINVVKPELIANTNTVKINTLLDKLPGVQIVDNQAIIRGGSGWSYGAGSRVLLLIDDIPALQGDAGRPLWGDIPVENISQIEVVKGASSTLYGSSAMNGIINIRTGYATAEPTTKAFVGYTHFMDPSDEAKKWWDSAPSRYTVGMVHKRKIGNLDMVANGFYENYDSYYQDGFERKYRLAANLKYRLSDRVVFGLNSLYNRGEAADNFIWRDGGSGAYKPADNTFSERITTRYYFDPQVSITTKNNDRHKILGRYYYVDNDNNLNQANSSYNTYLEYQFLKSFSEDKTSLAAGVVHQYINSDSELWSNVELSSTNMGAFVQLDHKLSEDITLTGGLRYEHNTAKSPEIFLGDTI
ncbi:MAG: TonB-dependent receptor plug domain-containing protein, partial [Saprospiraceae bacterium]|nr:TonB-dependent receptor plug domain-containing protein [Saprospiraceae bacterium]